MAVQDYATYLRQRRAAKRERGECDDCSNPAIPDKRRCQRCQERLLARQRERRAKSLREHTCSECGEKLRGRRRKCDTCRALKRECVNRLREERLAQGLCMYCGKEPVIKGTKVGKVCSRKKAAQQRQRRLGQKRVQEFRRLVARDPNGVAERLATLLRGRPPRVSDGELVSMYKELGTVRAVTDASGYADDVTVQRRLRRLGVTPGKPGRPRKEAG